MNDLAVEIDSIAFRYSGQAGNCLDNISLTIQRGAAFGLFGPNGAGKTTLMYLMTGLLAPQQGAIRILGIDSTHKNVKKMFGFVPQDFSFYQELNPVQNLEFFGAWSGLSKATIAQRTTELLNVLSLSDVKNKPVAEFSGGMKRRVNLAIGVIANPEILFLDEPTVGVDVQSRNAIIAYLKALNKKGTTLIYTSHQLHEAEELCDKVALIDAGKIIVHDHLSTLLIAHQEKGLEGLFLQLTGKAYRNADV